MCVCFLLTYVASRTNLNPTRLFEISWCFSKNESAGIAASIDAMAAGEDGPEVSGNGSKNAADDPLSVRWKFLLMLFCSD